IADSNATHLSMIARILETLGYHPDVASSCQGLRDSLERKAYDLILVELRLAHTSGSACTQLNRPSESGHPAPYVLALSVHTWPEEVERCRALGFDGVLPLPLSRSKLNQEIEHASRLRVARLASELSQSNA
ncbi:MAG: response regulator, partial [Rhodothermales bacterium]